MKLHILIFIALVSATSVCHALEQSIRYYSSGKLVNAAVVPPAAPGMVKIRTSKNRGYATNELTAMLREVAQEMSQDHPHRDRLQIGDVANRFGGTVGQHSSHQNGLDADVVYYRNNNQEQHPDWSGDYVEKFVKNGKLTTNFDIERNWKLLTKLASFPQVERVFVDVAIKKNFCKIYSNNSDPIVQQALRIMRPAELHHDHMHVRITCPPNSHRCRPQDPPPPGNGCSGTRMQLDLLQFVLEKETGC